MPKSSREQIRRDELKVIDLLRREAGQGIDSIAKKCGFSRQKVWRIIKRLEENGTIRGYTAVIDSRKIEAERFVVLVKRTAEPLNKKLVDAIIGRKLEEEGEKLGVTVRESHSVNGEFAWMLSFTAPDLETAKKFCEAIHAIYYGHISSLQLLQVVFLLRWVV